MMMDKSWMLGCDDTIKSHKSVQFNGRRQKGSPVELCRALDIDLSLAESAPRSVYV